MKRIYCIGQAPPRTDPSQPFGRTKLYDWFAQAGLTDFTLYNIRDVWDAIYVAKFEDKDVLMAFDAVYDKFPGSAKSGGHLAPTPEQMAAYLPRLTRKVQEFRPDLVLVIGKLSIAHFTGVEKLEDAIGKIFEKDIFGMKCHIIPLPHPSGASSWPYIPKNKMLIEQAIHHIREYLQR